MMKLQEIIEVEKKKYIDEVKKIRQKVGILSIYGAGTIGRALYDVLIEAGIIIDSICVTDKQHNNEQSFPVPMYEIGELNKFDKDKVGVLIAAENPINEDMIRMLNMLGIKKFIDVPKYAKRFMVYGINKRRILEITTRIGCSINCRYCPQSTLLHSYKSSIKELSLENYVRCIDKLPKDVIVRFAGFVEPFLSSDAEDMMQYAYKQGHEIELFTTLVGLTSDKLAKLQGLRFREVILHLPDSDGLATIPLNEDYFSVLTSILNMRYDDGVPVVTRGNCQGEIHSLIEPIISGQLLIFGEMNNRAGNLSDINLKSSNLKKGCIFCNGSDLWNHNVLLPDCSVVLCSMDFGLRHVLGNLLTDSYDSIINGNILNTIRHNLLSGQDENILCRTCTEARVL